MLSCTPSCLIITTNKRNIMGCVAFIVSQTADTFISRGRLFLAWISSENLMKAPVYKGRTLSYVWIARWTLWTEKNTRQENKTVCSDTKVTEFKHKRTCLCILISSLIHKELWVYLWLLIKHNVFSSYSLYLILCSPTGS